MNEANDEWKEECRVRGSRTVVLLAHTAPHHVANAKLGRLNGSNNANKPKTQ